MDRGAIISRERERKRERKTHLCARVYTRGVYILVENKMKRAFFFQEKSINAFAGSGELRAR